MNRLIVIFLVLFTSSNFYSQEWKTGIINDSDGYVNIRTGKGANFGILDLLYPNEIFHYADSTGESWITIRTTKCNCNDPHGFYSQVIGFVHRNNIEELDKLNVSVRKALFSEIFSTELHFYKQMINSSNQTSRDNDTTSRKRIVFHDSQFNGSLNAFTNYLCEFKDEELASQFVELLEEEIGSADESPTFALGRLFVCEPDWTFNQIINHMTLMDNLEWGILNAIYHMPEFEANQHRMKYNKLRASIGMSEVDFSQYE